MNAKDGTGETPLHMVEDLEVTKLLIDSGSDVNIKDEDGNTPLHSLMINFQFDEDYQKMLTLLLDFGANPFLKNKEGKIPLEELVIEDKKDYKYMKKIIKPLVEKMTDIIQEEQSILLTRYPTQKQTLQHRLRNQDLICPITNDTMYCPVKNITGSVYDKKAIETWHRKHKQKIKDPLKNISYEQRQLIYDGETFKKIYQIIHKSLQKLSRQKEGRGFQQEKRY